LTWSAFAGRAGAADLKNPRGFVVEVSRGPTRSRVRAKLVEVDTETSSGLPPSFDVKIVLSRIFSFSAPRPAIDGEITLIPPPDVRPVNLPPPIAAPKKESEPTGPVPRLMDEIRKKQAGGGK